MADLRYFGNTSNLIRFKLINSTTGKGITGLSSASSGLIISTICDNEATATVYTQAGSTIESITTLGTFAAPTASKCRFKEVDATNHPGLYEFQIADARFAVSNAKRMIVSVPAVTGLSLADADYEIQLTQFNPYDSVRMGMTALPNVAAGATNGLPLSVDSSGRVDVLKINGTSQTARDIGASVLLSSGTGTGQVKLSSGYVAPNWGDVGNPTTTVGLSGTTIKDATDVETKLGSPAGASVSVDIAAIKTDTGNLITRIPSALFSGITSLAQWLGLLAGKQTGNSTARTEVRATGAGSGTFDETTDSQEALRDRGDAAWITATGFAVPGDIMKVSSGTGANQIDLTGGKVKATVAAGDIATDAIDANALKADAVTEIQSGLSTLNAAGVRTAVGLASANLDTQLGAIDSDTGAIKVQTDQLIFNGSGNVAAAAGGSDFVHSSGKLWVLDDNGNPVANQADQSAIKAQTDQFAFTTANQVDANVIDKTGFELDSAYDPAKTAAQAGDAMTLTGAYDAAKTAAQVSDIPTPDENADALLARNIAGGSSTGRKVFEALSFLRNRWTLAGATLTIYDTDDTSVLWTSTVGTDPSADPIVGSDPA